MMVKWMLVLIGVAVTWALIVVVRDHVRQNRSVVERRNKTKCPSCGCDVEDMYETADTIAYQRIKERTAGAPEDMYITAAGHPVELKCTGCGTLLSFNLDDSVTIA